jgi:GT2 family glycosyltransferase
MLSIVIPSHNRADLLRLCLASVRRHAPADTEIVVVDDASPDHAVSRTAHDFAEVRVVRLSRRRGFCAAANAGIRAARNPIVELLNDDTEVSAGWAEAALDHFVNPQVAAVAPLVLRGPPKGQPPHIDSAGDRYFAGGVAGKRGHGQPLTATYLHGGEVFGASASSAFYRRNALLKVGAFPEEFGAYFEDVDLSFRLHWAGYRIVYEPASRVWHRVSASHGRPSRRLLEQQSRNEERVFWRNLPGRELLRALPWHGAVLVAKMCRRWQKGEWLPFVLGRLRALGEMPGLIRHRRRLREKNTNPDTAAWGIERRFWSEGESPAPLIRYNNRSASILFRVPNQEESMETAAMGKVLVTAKIENLYDVESRERGLLPAEQVRCVEVTDALVDTEAPTLLLPRRFISQLGLRHLNTRQARGLGGSLSLPMYSAVRLTIQGRDCALDVGEIEDTFPVLIGQIPLESLDWVVDTKNQRLIGNPAHGGEQIMDLF